jgi:hypothetical protein
MSKERVSSAPALSGRALARAIFDCDVPEAMIKEMPAQSLYYAILENGLDSSSDLLKLITIDQQKALLDFDCWESDNFREDRFWQWLEIACSEDDFSLLRKLIQAVDLKIIALIIGRQAEIVTNEEPTDAPPGPHFYTPDRGYTWIGLLTEDPDKERLIGRLLAYLYESNTDLFYQLIQIPTVETSSVLEEESFQDKERRIQCEGIPSRDCAFETISALKPEVALAALREPKTILPLAAGTVIEPIIAGRFRLAPLQGILERRGGLDDVKIELSHLMNCLVVRYNIPFFEDDVVKTLREKMLGAINIGLHYLVQKSNLDADEIISRGGFKTPLRVGLWLLQDLRASIVKLSESLVELLPQDSHLFLIVAGIRENIPALPSFYDTDLNFLKTPGPIEQEWKAFETLGEVESVRAFAERELQKLKH